MGKPVVATGNVHYLDENDFLYRKYSLPPNRESVKSPKTTACPF